MATAVPAGKPSTDVLVVGGGVIGLSVAVMPRERLDGSGHRRRSCGERLAGCRRPPRAVARDPPRAAVDCPFATQPPGTINSSSSAGAEGSRLTAHRGILEIALLRTGAETLNRGEGSSSDPVFPDGRSRQNVRPGARFGGSASSRRRLDRAGSPARCACGRIAAGGVHSGSRTRIDRDRSDIGVILDSGESIRAGHVVIAAGSWSPLIDGLPSRLPITPARGEVLVIEAAHAVGYAVAWDDGYFVPREGEIVVGATFELVGYDASDDGRRTIEPRGLRVPSDSSPPSAAPRQGGRGPAFAR